MFHSNRQNIELNSFSILLTPVTNKCTIHNFYKIEKQQNRGREKKRDINQCNMRQTAREKK